MCIRDRHLADLFLIPIGILLAFSNAFTFSKAVLPIDILLLISPAQLPYHVTALPTYLNKFIWFTVFHPK